MSTQTEPIQTAPPAALPPAPPLAELISIHCLVPSKNNVRTGADKDALKELANSIRAHGVLEPLLVRPLKVTFGDPNFEIVAGHRRFAAARIANLEKLPVIIRALDDAQAREIQIVENMQREGIQPVDEGLGYRALMDMGQPAAEVAKKVGKSESGRKEGEEMKRVHVL